MQCLHVIRTQARKLWWTHIYFTAVYQGGSKFTHENSKPQTPHIGFFSALKIRWHTTYTSAHTPVFNLCIWFGSCEVRRLNQSRSTAVIPSWAKREERLSRSKLYQPFRIDSDAVLHMNLIHWIRRIRLMWSTASEPGHRSSSKLLWSENMFKCLKLVTITVHWTRFDTTIDKSFLYEIYRGYYTVARRYEFYCSSGKSNISGVSEANEWDSREFKIPQFSCTGTASAILNSLNDHVIVSFP